MNVFEVCAVKSQLNIYFKKIVLILESVVLRSLMTEVICEYTKTKRGNRINYKCDYRVLYFDFTLKMSQSELQQFY